MLLPSKSNNARAHYQRGKRRADHRSVAEVDAEPGYAQRGEEENQTFSERRGKCRPYQTVPGNQNQIEPHVEHCSESDNPHLDFQAISRKEKIVSHAGEEDETDAEEQ